MARILIIDDDLSIQQLFKQFLSGEDHNVLSASNGKEGLRLMKQQKPDLIITDIMMPEMDGLEVVREIRKTDLLNHPARGRERTARCDTKGYTNRVLKPAMACRAAENSGVRRQAKSDAAFAQICMVGKSAVARWLPAHSKNHTFCASKSSLIPFSARSII
jgi:CheY-like chemotaxis protein